MMRVLPVAALVTLLSTHAFAAPPPEVHARMDDERVDYVVNADRTYVETDVRDDTLLTARGLQLRDRAVATFYPETQSLDVVEAWTTEPDGEHVNVTPDNIFTRPSEESQDAPGFSDSQTTTVLFPRLREGARTHIVWRLTERKPSVMGFNTWDDTPADEQTVHQQITIDAPASMNLHWGGRGYAVTESAADGHRRIVAAIGNIPPERPERSMVAKSDVRPVFASTTFDTLAQIGAVYARQSAEQAKPTPEIIARAREIAGDRTGPDAARAIYDWVARRIRYVAIYLDPEAGWVPHSAEEVLRQGYGDCKDHVVLMQAMLAAVGVHADAALVNWGESFASLDVPSPFQFNHAIVYLPDYHRFLNPTDPFATFDAVDRSLADKVAVIATQDGSVTRTPASDPAQNTYRFQSDIVVGADGTMRGTADMAVAPTIDSSLRRNVALAPSHTELAEHLLGETPEGGFGSVTTSDPRDLDTPFTAKATWESPHGVVLSGPSPRFAIPSGIDFRRVGNLRQWLAPDHVRAHPMVAGALDFEWCYTVHLPPGMTAGDVPQSVDLSNSAGTYRAQYELSGEGLHVVRRLTVDSNVYAADAYPALERLIYAALDDSRAIFTMTERQAAR
jgi:Domain of Unknown Function with PDB structure (DUF3857)/Transglutaminase-like superfamily/Domain of Unknown Function with PDB structure (DUF3858)